ncbi:hypothetical protein [Nocardioides yefusunii]|uniref:Uncharacterized protein n=1 Tax=Nocardioides yefusunii TaxID=2500546 RepID=A0ABW1R2K7_9ACTN|nr:hypothetical protein [Nocardioides yefusunii]
MKTDEELHTLFRDASNDAAPDFAVHRVVAGATTRGRSLRRRSVAVRTVGSLAVVAVVAPLAWVGVGQLGGDEGQAPSVAAPASQAAALSGPQRIAFTSDTLAPELVDAVQELRPGADITVREPFAGYNRVGRIAVVEVNEDGQGGNVEIQLWPSDGTMEEVSTSVCDPINGESTCTSVAGGTLATSVGDYSGTSIVSHTATFVRPDGIRVVATASNTEVAVWPAPVIGDAPVLDDAALAALATSDRWVEDGAPDPAPTQDVPLGTLALDIAGMQAELIDQLQALAPDATVSAAPAAQGAGPRVGAVVDDGHGQAFVDLYLGTQMPGFVYGAWLNESGACGAGCSETDEGRLEVYDGADDGTPDEIGVWNGATYQRADGVEVLVSISNTAGPKFDATTTTRATPPLTGEQLAAIATSDVWVD